MAQNYTDIQPSELISNSLSLLLSNFETIMSSSSGTAFPTADLQNGMWCFRSDQNKMYLLLDKTVPNWFLIFDLNDPMISLSLLTSQLALKQDKIVAGSAIEDLVNNLLTSSRAVVTDASGKIVVSPATAGEVAALAGLTGNVQAQFNTKQNKITISAAAPSGGTDGDIWLQVES